MSTGALTSIVKGFPPDLQGPEQDRSIAQARVMRSTPHPERWDLWDVTAPYTAAREPTTRFISIPEKTRF